MCIQRAWKKLFKETIRYLFTSMFRISSIIKVLFRLPKLNCGTYSMCRNKNHCTPYVKCSHTFQTPYMYYVCPVFYTDRCRDDKAHESPISNVAFWSYVIVKKIKQRRTINIRDVYYDSIRPRQTHRRTLLIHSYHDNEVIFIDCSLSRESPFLFQDFIELKMFDE